MSLRPYHLVDMHLVRKQELSPHLSRLTFTGDAVGKVQTCGPDQRIKVFFPSLNGNDASMPTDETWMQAYQSMPAEDRPQRRSYTIRSLREDELDIDFVLHGETGPASTWAIRSKPGAKVQMAVPNRDYNDDPGGYEWQPPADIAHVLLIADETALPSVAGILEDLAKRAHPPQTDAYVEVPTADDCIDLADFPGLSMNWMPRSGTADYGEFMIDAALGLPMLKQVKMQNDDIPDIDVDKDILWDSASQTSSTDVYIWVAGEAEAVKKIRHLLIKERGIDRRSANLMGYWRKGRAYD